MSSLLAQIAPVVKNLHCCATTSKVLAGVLRHMVRLWLWRKSRTRLKT